MESSYFNDHINRQQLHLQLHNLHNLKSTFLPLSSLPHTRSQDHTRSYKLRTMTSQALAHILSMEEMGIMSQSILDAEDTTISETVEKSFWTS